MFIAESQSLIGGVNSYQLLHTSNLHTWINEIKGITANTRWLIIIFYRSQ